MADTKQERGTIVVGADGSESSRGALAWAARQASLTGDKLRLVVAWDWPTSYGWDGPLPSDYNPEADARKMAEEALAQEVRDFPGVDAEVETVKGHPAPALLEHSKDADLLVVGSRGHGEFAGMLIGSVSAHCTAHAPCPVVVVRPKGK